jgi:hypothetical protein
MGSNNQNGGEGVIKKSLHSCANHKGPQKLSQKIAFFTKNALLEILG